jgi:hypothetical protein
MNTDFEIINPDRFVQRLPRPNTDKAGAGHMCDACLFGQHDACTDEACPCVHRLLRVGRMLRWYGT